LEVQEVTHDELLAEIDQWLTHSEIAKRQPNKAINVLKALRAVVELHKEKLDDIGRPVCSGCFIGSSWRIYPCQTIQAIEKELG